MTMHKALHPRDDVDICIKKGERGRDVSGSEDCVGTAKQRLEEYIQGPNNIFRTL